jgi:hypothetical protein
VIKSLSPTALSVYLNSPESFYLTYKSEVRPPRVPQNQAMAVGSAFDAYVKGSLIEKLFGTKGKFEEYFQAQVEPQNRDWALKAGKHCYEEYVKLGSLASLLDDLKKCVGKPRFEFAASTTVRDVPFSGKPDLFYINSEGAHVIFDWKVNGYCSKSGASPNQGYIRLRPAGTAHKDAMVMKVNGMYINVASYLEDVNEDWARQLSIYGWTCGEEVGHEIITCIDQLAWKDGNLRVAEHRTRVRSEFQEGLYKLAAQMWEIVNSDHYFRDLTLEESKLKEEQLQRVGPALKQFDWIKDMM